MARTIGAEISGNEARSQSNHLLDLVGSIGSVSLSTDKSLGCSNTMGNDRNIRAGHRSWHTSSIGCDSCIDHRGNIFRSDGLSIEGPVCSWIGDCVWLRVLGATSASDEDIVARVEQLLWDRRGSSVLRLREPVDTVLGVRAEEENDTLACICRGTISSVTSDVDHSEIGTTTDPGVVVISSIRGDSILDICECGTRIVNESTVVADGIGGSGS